MIFHEQQSLIAQLLQEQIQNEKETQEELQYINNIELELQIDRLFSSSKGFNLCN